MRVRGSPKEASFAPQVVVVSNVTPAGFWYFRSRVIDSGGRPSNWTQEISRVVETAGDDVTLTLTPSRYRTDTKQIYEIVKYEIEYGQTSGALNNTQTHMVRT